MAAVSPVRRLERALDAIPLQSFLTYRLARLNARLNRQASAVLKRSSGLRIPEWRVIALLATHGEMNASAIGDLSGADPGLLSRTFRALEERALIASRRSASDRREVFCALTAEGWRIHAATAPVMRARQLSLLGVLSPAERSMVFRIIDKLESAAETRDFGEDEE